MPQEFETRILDIDKLAILQRLAELGAQEIKNVMQRRWTFDFPDRRLQQEGGWVRLRDTGDGKLWLAYKNHKPAEGVLANVQEVEVEVSDLEKTKTFLGSIGLEQKGYQENKRHSFRLDDLAFEIDEWPMLEPMLEIEGPSESRVLEGVALLGFTPADTFQGHAGDAYAQKGIDWRSMPEIRF